VTRTTAAGEVVVELAPDPRSGRVAREAVGDLADLLHPETMAKVRLLVTELVVAVLGPAQSRPLRLTVRLRDGRVRAAIAPVEDGALLDRPHSWNLFLVNRIADAWEGDGRGLWFEVAAR
jgi:hypothetical protein